jgi:F-type H+-transporting ATPase subunit gamma
MPSLKEVRERIISVKSTQQITSAMKMVSASKLRRAQNAILKLRPYAAKFKEILINVSSALEDIDDSIYSKQRTPEKILLVVITSNRGMCGGFNSNIIKATNLLINNEYASQQAKGNLSLITIGRKGTDYFKKRNYKVVESFNDWVESPSFDKVAPVVEKLMKEFADGEYDKIEIIYNQFKNAVTQILTNEPFLPVMQVIPAKTAKKKTLTDYIYEPGRQEIIKELIPKSLKIQFYKAILDSIASEQGARMTAMHQATENASEIIKSLNLAYNKARQAAITKEILEIVSGAEALKQ